jgi:DNA-binding MarR family transcriptional regulator
MHVTQIDSARLETQPGSDAASLLSQIGAHATTRFSSSLAMLELAPVHATMIQVLALQPGMSQSALAKTLKILPSRMVAYTDQLETKGLLERRLHRKDRRNYALHLTKAGHAAYRSATQLVQRHHQTLLAGLTRQQQTQLAELLQIVAREQGLTANQVPQRKAETHQRNSA